MLVKSPSSLVDLAAILEVVVPVDRVETNAKLGDVGVGRTDVPQCRDESRRQVAVLGFSDAVAVDV